MFLSTGIWSTSPASQAETPHGVSGAPMSTGAAPTGWTAAFYGRSPPRGSSTPPSMWTPPAPSGPGWIWIPLSCWRSRTRAGEDTRPYKTQGTLRACVGAGLRPARGRPWCAAPTDYGPGALAEKSQAQVWNRIGCNFCTPRARWPGLNGEKALRFCAPEGFCLFQGVTPVMGVLGGRRIWTRSVHPEPSP